MIQKGYLALERLHEDKSLICFCPANHVPDWQPRILLGMVEARSVNVMNTHTHTTLYNSFFLFFSFFFHLTYSRWTSSLPSCLWSQRIFPSLPGSRLTIFLSRCKFSTLTTRQPTVEFYLLTFPRFPSRKKGHKSYFGKNRTHDFRTSRCAAYLLDHSGNGTDQCQNRSTTLGGGAGGRRSLVIRGLSVILTLQPKFLNRVRSYVDLYGLRSFRVCSRPGR